MAKKPQRQVKNFVFRKHAKIGAADAIDDKKFLEECFVDTGELEILRDMTKPECIVVGRTGSGKTALLEQLATTEEKAIKIAPEGLALAYVSDNEILKFFIAAGVNMDLFYRLLWRHVFAVEIIREHYNIINEQTRDNFLTQIRARVFRNKSKEEAINYLVRFGESFWKESEYRVKELTTTLTEDLQKSVSGALSGAVPNVGSAQVSLNAGLANKLTEEQKAEIVHHGQSVVDKIQMKTLSEIINILEEILDDKQRRYYITIDRLDENWVNEDLRYRLISALLDTIRDFNTKIQNVKIVVAVREDLLDRVFRYTRNAGYQEEKYKSLYLQLTWKEDDLIGLLDKRVRQLVKEQYTKKEVTLGDILPTQINKGDPIKYIMARTLLRPRDAIMFFNECIRTAEGKAKITQQMIFQAEATYSDNRLRAIGDEWSADYPNLIELCLFLKKFPPSFKPKEICKEIEECLLNFQIKESPQTSDYISSLIKDKFDSGDTQGFVYEMLKIMYRVGLVGVKLESYAGVNWSFQGQKSIKSDLTGESVIHVHPAFWRVLGIQQNATFSESCGE